jgi:hypothetical protein
MRSKFFNDGIITEVKKSSPHKKISLTRALALPTSRLKDDAKIINPPQTTQPSVDIDKLADKIVDKLKDIPTTLISDEVKNIDKDPSSLVQIDETLIDTGTDISNLQGDDLTTKEEEKVDDLKKAKEKLSKLKRRKHNE